MSNKRVLGHSNPPCTRILVPLKTRGFHVKPELVTGFSRPGCTRRVPGFQSCGVHLYYGVPGSIDYGTEGVRLFGRHLCSAFQNLANSKAPAINDESIVACLLLGRVGGHPFRPAPAPPPMGAARAICLSSRLHGRYLSRISTYPSPTARAPVLTHFPNAGH